MRYALRCVLTAMLLLCLQVFPLWSGGREGRGQVNHFVLELIMTHHHSLASTRGAVVRAQTMKASHLARKGPSTQTMHDKSGGKVIQVQAHTK